MFMPASAPNRTGCIVACSARTRMYSLTGSSAVLFHGSAHVTMVMMTVLLNKLRLKPKTTSIKTETADSERFDPQAPNAKSILDLAIQGSLSPLFSKPPTLRSISSQEITNDIHAAQNAQSLLELPAQQPVQSSQQQLLR